MWNIANIEPHNKSKASVGVQPVPLTLLYSGLLSSKKYSLSEISSKLPVFALLSQCQWLFQWEPAWGKSGSVAPSAGCSEPPVPRSLSKWLLELTQNVLLGWRQWSLLKLLLFRTHGFLRPCVFKSPTQSIRYAHCSPSLHADEEAEITEKEISH